MELDPYQCKEKRKMKKEREKAILNNRSFLFGESPPCNQTACSICSTSTFKIQYSKYYKNFSFTETHWGNFLNHLQNIKQKIKFQRNLFGNRAERAMA